MKLDQAVSLCREDGGHHAVGVELFARVADVLANGVNAQEQLIGNILWAESLRQETQHLKLPSR